MHYTTWLHCSVPRVMNKESKVTTIEVPWADYSKRYTHLFAAAVTAWLLFTKNKRRTAALFRTSCDVVQAILQTKPQAIPLPLCIFLEKVV
jgi:transposase